MPHCSQLTDRDTPHASFFATRAASPESPAAQKTPLHRLAGAAQTATRAARWLSQALTAAGTRGRAQRQSIDSAAATVLLTAWLEAQSR